MYRRWRSGVGRATVLLLLFGNAMAGRAASASETKLDRDGVVRLALVRNHDLQAARAQVKAALGRLQQAGLWPSPRLELNNDTDRPFANEGGYARSVGLSQEFPISGRLSLAEDVARVDVALALAEVNEAERKLIGDVASTYFDIVVIDQKLQMRDDLIRSVTNLEAASRARFRAGEVSELDVNAATLELLRLKQDRALLVGERAATLRALAGAVGLDAAEALILDTAAAPIKAIDNSPASVGQAIERRPDLRLLNLSANRAEAENALASASAWEDWNLSLGVRRDRLVIQGLPRQQADDVLTMTLSIPIPLVNRNQGTQNAATAEKEASLEKAIALRQRIENEVIGLLEQLTQLLGTVKAYEAEALPLSRKNSELARAAYHNGQISIVDVVQAERQEKDVGANYADALSQYFHKIVLLDTAMVSNAELMTRPVETIAAKLEGE